MIDKIIEIEKLSEDIKNLLKDNRPEDYIKVDNFVSDMMLMEVLKKYNKKREN